MKDIEAKQVTGKRIAIMQPYLFPYIGYFQLIAAVDEFIVLDTVQFIRLGWMQRNRIKVDGADRLFGLPIRKAPHTTPILDIEFAGNAKAESQKIIATLTRAYRSAPYWPQLEALAVPLLEAVQPGESFAAFTLASLNATCGALGLHTPILSASCLAPRRSPDAQTYVIDICQERGATQYINSIGGVALYKVAAFAGRGLELRFLRPRNTPYLQTVGDFIPDLSVLDLIANLHRGEITERLELYDLLEAESA